ncbi:hypothetical protein H5410_001176 [Solanum commersonii]|uniref:Uncharacterized protein n=1 Tax=Solanum commersonii TaxID=4109 RepID=A0A9J6AYZ0_SOLCO|nr:hypothetical protein H5410_001176 [Solanum commersonii]
MSTCESEMEYCSFGRGSKKDLKKAFQHFNHGTIVEWKHEESMSSSERYCRQRVKKRHESGFRNLSAHVIKSVEDVCVISDRAKGILTSSGVSCGFQEPPGAFHRFCIRHPKSNFQSKFPNKDLTD